MFHQITSYLKFLLKSTNQHGVHSPFVYNLITSCFYDRKYYADYSKLSIYKKELLKNNSEIIVNDLGPGSRVIKSSKRRISEIAKHAGSTKKRAQLLYRLSRYFKFKHTLELGTSLGVATFAIHKRHPCGNIKTIEGCPNISAFTKKYLKHSNAHNINIITNNFSEEISNLNQTKLDFIYIDGNHTKKATLHYFETLLKHAHNNTMFLFDDIYWSKEMTEAWNIIKKHPKTKVSIDCFWCGFIFIRKEQVKQHFTIRLKKHITTKLVN